VTTAGLERDDELFAWVQYGGGQQLWDALNGQFNVKSLLCTSTGCQMGGWFAHEITSPERLKEHLGQQASDETWSRTLDSMRTGTSIQKDSGLPQDVGGPETLSGRMPYGLFVPDVP
jgi:hypothetical protein